ncbi:MAG: sigma-70 family RNA polymerase sigma factor [Candidatus Kapaibacteriales bacterium]
MGNGYKEYEDANLFALMSPGNKESGEAFAELYSRYSQRVYAYCVKFLANKDEAQDVFQEVFVRFYQSADRKKDMTNVPGYLLTITRNLCVNSVRSKKPMTNFEEYMGEAHNEDADNDEMLQLVRDAVSQLQDDYREVFILREYDGMSYQDIADVTGEKLSNVKVKIYRAKQKIRDILKPYLEEIRKLEKRS